MASCPTCSARLRAQYVGSEFACPACGDRLKSNPYAAGLMAFIIGAVTGGFLMSMDESWPWFVAVLVVSILVTYVFWRVLFRIEQK
jgi:uncharacterized protein (DUF983 family)